MKKIVTLLLAMAMVLSLAVGVNAATTAGVNTVCVEDENGLITATVSVVNVAQFAGMKMGLGFDNTKVALLKADKTAASTTDTYDVVVDVVDAKFGALSGKGITIKSNYVVVNFAAASGAEYYDVTDEAVQFKLYFQKVAGATIDDATFTNYYKTTTKTYYLQGTAMKYSNKDNNFAVAVTPYVPAVDEPAIEKGEATEELEAADVATAAAADKGTLTFVAKVSAEYKEAAYGVIVAGKKFFGAPASSIADPDFAWDGSFEIVLTNITEKGTAGEKAYQYFVGDALTDSATVNVVAE